MGKLFAGEIFIPNRCSDSSQRRDHTRARRAIRTNLEGLPRGRTSVPGGPDRLVEDRRALGELEVEGRRGECRIRLEVGHLGHAGHLVADRLDETGDEAVEAVDGDLDVVVGSVDLALDRARVVALDDDRLAPGDAVRARDPAVAREPVRPGIPRLGLVQGALLPGFAIVALDRCQGGNRGAVDHRPVGLELRSVARAVPAFLEAVPVHDTADVRANGAALSDRAILAATFGRKWMHRPLGHELELAGNSEPALTGLDLQALESAAGRTFSDAEREQFLQVQHRAQQWTFLGCAMGNRHFLKAVATVSDAAAKRLEQAAGSFAFH